jgi:hypothetical protein
MQKKCWQSAPCEHAMLSGLNLVMMVLVERHHELCFSLSRLGNA